MWHLLRSLRRVRRAQDRRTRRLPGSHLFIAFVLAMCLLWPSSAYAYLDPATGGYVVQMILAMLVSVTFVARRFWGQVVSFCGRLFSGPTPPAPPTQPTQNDGPKA